MGFHNQHDCRELKRLCSDLGIEINQVIPEGGSIKNLKSLGRAWFNIVPYREVGLMAAHYLEKEFDMPFVNITPMGVIDTAAFVREIGNIVNGQAKQGLLEDKDAHFLHPSLDDPLLCSEREARRGVLMTSGMITKGGAVQSTVGKEMQKRSKGHSTASNKLHKEKTDFISDSFLERYIDSQTRFVSQAAWFSRSIDCQNLTGKRVVVFGDGTHAASMTKILAREMGIRVSCAGTYCRHDADWFREQVEGFCDEVLITEDHTQVGDMIARIEPVAIFGTQMERHIGKRLDIPCGVISAPVHIQNFPLGYRPFLGYEGTNQIADLVYNSFTLGMEDHLLEIFGGHDTKEVITKSLSNQDSLSWAPDGITELSKIPGFVRGKVKRNTEKFARENNIAEITVEIMYAAKEAAGA